MEVLTAYVRENARWEADKVSKPTFTWQQLENAPLVSTLTSGVTTDIQTILDVLGRRNENIVPESYQKSISLHHADLSGANLVGANLAGADLAKTNLSGAYLTGADLSKANLAESDLSGCLLTGANLSGANLRDSHLEGARLHSVTISNVQRERTALLRLRGVIDTDTSAADDFLVNGTNIETATWLTQEQIEWAIGDASTKQPEYLDQPEAWRETISVLSYPDEPQPPSYEATQAERDEEERMWQEWEECDRRRVEGLKKQEERIAQRLKQEHWSEDETTTDRVNSQHNGAKNAGQGDNE
jgi:uncharacterized protein YjbI with pentapeptide repeats